MDIVPIPYDANMQNQQTYQTLWLGDEWTLWLGDECKSDVIFKCWSNSMRTEVVWYLDDIRTVGKCFNFEFFETLQIRAN